MDPESIREFCLSLPHATEGVQWENDLLFRIGDKMFAVLALEPSHGVVFCFKATPEEFAELSRNHPGTLPGALSLGRPAKPGCPGSRRLAEGSRGLLPNGARQAPQKGPRPIRNLMQGFDLSLSSLCLSASSLCALCGYLPLRRTAPAWKGQTSTNGDACATLQSLFDPKSGTGIPACDPPAPP